MVDRLLPQVKGHDMEPDKEDFNTIMMLVGVCSTETQIPSQQRWEAAQTVLRFLERLRDKAPDADVNS